MLEAAKDNGGFSTVQATPLAPTGGSSTSAKNKSKRVFATLNLSDPESEDEVTTSAHVITGNSTWIKPGSNYKFPCPLQNTTIMRSPPAQISLPSPQRIAGSKPLEGAFVILA